MKTPKRKILISSLVCFLSSSNVLGSGNTQDVSSSKSTMKLQSSKKKFSKIDKNSERTPASLSAQFGSNDPDFEKEAQFNSIYKNYNEHPTSFEAWENASGARKAEEYTIQKGDTLSDVSGTFFGDPFFWPKIWSFNSGSIENPHEIEPQMQIRFFAGDFSESPSVEVGSGNDSAQLTQTSNNEEVAQNSQGDLSTQLNSSQLLEQAGNLANGLSSVKLNSSKKIAKGLDEKELSKFKIPAPRTKYAPVLSKIPDSLPTIKFSNKNVTPSFIEFPNRKISSVNRVTEFLSFYVNDAPVKGVGQIQSADLDLKAVGEHTHVYVRLESAASKKFYVIKNIGPISSISNSSDGEGPKEGHIVEVQGLIEVLDLVNPEKKIYRAIVKKSLSLVEVGSMLIPGDLPTMDSTPTSPVAGPRAHIIGGNIDNKLFGPLSLAFIDVGARKGIQVGTSYPIFAEDRLRYSETEVAKNERQIGVIKIVHNQVDFATGIITSVTGEVMAGDYVGSLDGGDVSVNTTPQIEEENPSLENEPVKDSHEPDNSSDSGLEEEDLDI